ncbi:MAG: PrsW family intramembrane metalloprotease [Eubacteriaceae bacterium]|nr:PrsW family intramembrane metalloprotease [Eubacteriaceae bacterium]
MSTRILIGALAPVIALILLFYFIDRRDKEPAANLAIAFFSGVAIVLPVLIVETILTYFAGGRSTLAGAAFSAFIIAGLTEEYFKRMVLVKRFYHSPYFDEKLDGIIYAVFIALGFAAVENIMYLYNFSHIQNIGIYRGLLSVPAHMMFGVTMGYYISMSKYCSDPVKCKGYFRKSLYIPVILHGTFNFLIMSGRTELMVLFFPFVFYLWLRSFRLLSIYYNDSKRNHLTK